MLSTCHHEILEVEAHAPSRISNLNPPLTIAGGDLPPQETAVEGRKPFGVAVDADTRPAHPTTANHLGVKVFVHPLIVAHQPRTTPDRETLATPETGGLLNECPSSSPGGYIPSGGCVAASEFPQSAWLRLRR